MNIESMLEELHKVQADINIRRSYSYGSTGMVFCTISKEHDGTKIEVDRHGEPPHLVLRDAYEEFFSTIKEGNKKLLSPTLPQGYEFKQIEKAQNTLDDEVPF